ncbi:MAG: hypothetical protein JO356_06525 [Acidobacteria bacterium]|nr:hypothetical protein [Acidobacteriota bacterium]
MPFLSLGEPPIRAVILTRLCGDLATAGGPFWFPGFWVFRACDSVIRGLLWGIGGSQKRAAFGMGVEGDT